MWHLKENVEENEDISMTAGGILFLMSRILKERKVFSHEANAE
jgi:hypothetical protein